MGLYYKYVHVLEYLTVATIKKKYIYRTTLAVKKYIYNMGNNNNVYNYV